MELTVSHVGRLTSQAPSSGARVQLEFLPDADMELVAVEVRVRKK